MSGERIWVERLGTEPRWCIRSNYFSKKLVEHAKAVPGVHWEANSKAWAGYPDAIAAVVARLGHVGLRVDAGALPGPDDWRKARTPFLFATQGAKGYTLRDYQVEGVRFLINKAREGALLADSMRLGKSAVATVAARAFKQRTLILCPSIVTGVWGRAPDDPIGDGEVALWWPDAWKTPPGVVTLESVRPALVASKLAALKKKSSGRTLQEDSAEGQLLLEQAGFLDKLKEAQVIVCHYDIVYAWVDVLQAWGVQTLILDEAHVLAGYTSRRAGAILQLAEQAQQRMILTGTPIPNTPQKLHNILSIIANKRFGHFFWTSLDKSVDPPQAKIAPGCYANLFCGAAKKEVGRGEEKKEVWDFSGRGNLDQPDGVNALTYEETLQARVRYIMLRRLKKDVDKTLPEKTRQIVDIQIPANKMLGLSHMILGGSGQDLRRVLDLAADGKLKAVSQLAVGHLNEGEKTVVACYRRLFAEKVAEEIQKKAPPNALITWVHGGLSVKERDQRMHEAKSWARGPAVLIGTIDTISTGIKLAWADVMVVGELVWEPADLAQLEERLYEYGADSKSLIQYVIARGTGDELILRGIIQKLDTFERVIGSTGDGMKAGLEAKRGDAMKRLGDALRAMQAAGAEASDERPLAKEPKTGTRKRKKEPQVRS